MMIDQPIEAVLTVPGAISRLLSQRKIVTIRDLIALKGKTIRWRSVGDKKRELIADLIEQANLLLEKASFDDSKSKSLSEDQATESNVEQVAPAIRQVPPSSDIAAGQANAISADSLFEHAPLLFLPSLLSKSFETLGISTVSQLIAYSESEFAKIPNWGEGKRSKAVATRNFYKRLAGMRTDLDNSLIHEFVPAEILPTSALVGLTVTEFLKSYDTSLLSGKTLQEVAHLRRLLESRLLTGAADIMPADEFPIDALRFVPGILEETFRQRSIRTIRDLLSISHTDIDGWTGIGSAKRKAIESAQELYRRLLPFYSDQGNSDATAEFGKVVLGKLVPALFLHDHTLQSVSVETFVESKISHLIHGKKRDELAALQKLLRSVCVAPMHQSKYDLVDWKSIPLRLNARIESFLTLNAIETIGEIELLLRTQTVIRDGIAVPLRNLESTNFDTKSLEKLQEEVRELVTLGIDAYRFGAQGVPESAVELLHRVRQNLDGREFDVICELCQGKTLEVIGEKLEITRERVRQIAKKSVDKLKSFKPYATLFLNRITSASPETLVFSKAELAVHSGLDEAWKVGMLVMISGDDWDDYGVLQISRLPKRVTITLAKIAKAMIEAVEEDDMNDLENVGNLIDACQTLEIDIESYSELERWRDQPCTLASIVQLFGENWLQANLRKQLVAAGPNGLFLDEIDSSGLDPKSPQFLEALNKESIQLPDGRYRREGVVYDKAGELLDLLKQSPTPIDAPELMKRSKHRWHQAPLVGMLSKSYEAINVSRGMYLHIEHLGLSRQDVRSVANWGEALLHGVICPIDGNKLFQQYQWSDVGVPIRDAQQLVSMIAKHPNIRRLSNNLEIAHKDSLDKSELSLAKQDPEIASQWHPSKNGTVTPLDVRPNSFKPRWWQCPNGHEWEAMPVYRTRMIRSCPGCQERWNVGKLKVFVQSLAEHIDSFSPSELYVLFQQSGLLNHSGRARGFVKALATGRFPASELKAFGRNEPSLVDNFMSDQSVKLEDTNTAETPDMLSTPDAAPSPEGRIEPVNTVPTDRTGWLQESLPNVSAKSAIRALNAKLIPTSDEEAIEFFISKKKSQIWAHAYRNEAETVQQVIETLGQTEYASRVRQEFLTEHHDATTLLIPTGYSFSKHGIPQPPNLMQRHVAVSLRERFRYGNWSGTGAGKTLSAVLATRVCNARLTVICCPNAVVGNEESGWMGEILRIYPDSDVQRKTWSPVWRSGSQYRYLILNYEHFQQPASEAELKKFLNAFEIDFLVIDEVHFAKQRQLESMSQRKRLVQAMVVEAGKKNSRLRVLGMSATPVINNLQEGKSLIEMITGRQHDDLPTRENVPNCMRLHQRLVTLGTRWRPEYEAQLVFEYPEVDCSSHLGEISELGTTASPLEIEKILTIARLPSILRELEQRKPTLIYSHYVGEVDQLLYDAISSVGFRVGFYTGNYKDGLDPFREGNLDVLIGSSAVGTGVDGLQHVCNRLIINALPWTNAEFEQLVGRIWRQGQQAEKVRVVIPVTFANIGANRWSYCEAKLARIHYKRTISDAAVDGVVPEGDLRSPAQAQRDVMKWLERLLAGEVQTVTRAELEIPLSGDTTTRENRLARYGDFSMMNNRWNRSKSSTLLETLRENPEEWGQYHTLYRDARQDWPIVPFEEFIRWCEKRSGYTIADFGCGEAIVAKRLGNRHKVFSFDHVAIDDSVTAGDMSRTGLEDSSIDVALFSLSLMGSNVTDYLREANRVLKIDGQLHIWEAASRFDDFNRFAKDLDKLGFQMFKPVERGQFIHLEGKKTGTISNIDFRLAFRLVKQN